MRSTVVEVWRVGLEAKKAREKGQKVYTLTWRDGSY